VPQQLQHFSLVLLAESKVSGCGLAVGFGCHTWNDKRAFAIKCPQCKSVVRISSSGLFPITVIRVHQGKPSAHLIPITAINPIFPDQCHQ
jgi:hypothetical protein